MADLDYLFDSHNSRADRGFSDFTLDSPLARGQPTHLKAKPRADKLTVSRALARDPPGAPLFVSQKGGRIGSSSTSHPAQR